jgi:hypothetical protein
LGKVLNVRWQEKSAALEDKDSESQTFTEPVKFFGAITAEHPGSDYDHVEGVSAITLAGGYFTPVVAYIPPPNIITEVGLLNVVSCWQWTRG